MPETTRREAELVGAADARRAGENFAARFTNVVLGVWLFLSAFLWDHTRTSFTNTWVLGLIITAIALVALAVPKVRYLNSLAAIWLFLSALAIEHAALGTPWHNAVLATVVFVVSLLPHGRRRPLGRRAAASV